ncbi:Pho23p SKDI_14G2270 [Saccharomyces kudriavzevii IFO 1802]|uniref:Chromatin modification-related protein n=2 Tax=Saccharomyces kudriavzevii (strain ATCC MYA-4449 / AS 2.2408 / CBS 8840 / NBRC 1802 / NCYC 2889) TaxID=226230 RepID=J5RH99_SACK1|nr:uncharacterized protein SKDI_14G2270 [Saccharomyces kudriavzevii IFO 1802]EJT41576.1 PHO23-like protein [Saccharomyces kudriavzevii IFO 1802]CAI4049994.1 hypothetical protein SKDI_14G2270 [Saccharomyces kudriavzevii IFO 1802]
MSSPANLFPGLNDITDVLEEFPLATSRYLTLLHEIDAKCVHSMPNLNERIDKFLKKDFDKDHQTQVGLLNTINKIYEELMPSLEEKMHVSSIMLDNLDRLTSRLELAYEVAIKNTEIPKGLRLGVDNHPAMHLHHELMEKIETKSNSKSSQALKSESRREAMAANRRQGEHYSANAQPQDDLKNDANYAAGRPESQDYTTNNANSRKRTSAANANTNVTETETKKRKRRVATTSVPLATVRTTAAVNSNSSRISRPKTNDYGEPLYCYCNQVAYGEMVGCDGADCELEWFHLPCIGLETLPKGKWYCDDCKKKL